MLHRLVKSCLVLLCLAGFLMTFRTKSPSIHDACPRLPLKDWGWQRSLLFFSHERLYDDFVAIWTIEQLMNAQRASCILSVVSDIKQVKPRIEPVYLLGSMILGFDYHQAQAAFDLAATGLENFPNSFRLLMTAGVFSGFFLKEKQKSAGYFALAYREKNIPYIQSLSAKLANGMDLDSDDVTRIIDEIDERKLNNAEN